MTILSNAAKQFYEKCEGVSLTADSMVISMLPDGQIRATMLRGGTEIAWIDSRMPVNFAAGETLLIDGVRITMDVQLSGGP